ncbi:MAG: hypothetical protein RLZZ301_256 [Bacteroidota bacterium]
MKKISLSIITLFVLISCHKNDPATTAIISFDEPILNDTVAFMDSVHAEGSIVGNGKMHGFRLLFTDQVSGVDYINESTSNIQKEYAFHEHWLNQVTDTTTIRVRVEVELDGKGAKSILDRNVVCLPQ